MRPTSLILMLGALLFGGSEARANSLRFDLSIGDPGLRPFYAVVGDYYPAPQRDVIIVRERYFIPEEEVPVAYFVANRANVSVAAVIDRRQRGESWGGISRHFGMGPVFYIPVRTGPPYGRAYGYYNHKPKKDWDRHEDHGKGWKHRGWKGDDD